MTVGSGALGREEFPLEDLAPRAKSRLYHPEILTIRSQISRLQGTRGLHRQMNRVFWDGMHGIEPPVQRTVRAATQPGLVGCATNGDRYVNYQYKKSHGAMPELNEHFLCCSSRVNTSRNCITLCTRATWSAPVALELKALALGEEFLWVKNHHNGLTHLGTNNSDSRAELPIENSSE